MDWMQGLGDALQAFGRAKMAQDEAKREQAERDRQFSLQQQQLQRALSQDKIQFEQMQRQENRQKAQDIREAIAPGQWLDPNSTAALQAGGLGGLVQSEELAGPPAPGQQGPLSRSVMGLSPQQAWAQQQAQADEQRRAEQMAFEREKFNEMMRQFGVEQANLLKRTQISAAPDQKDYGGYAVAQMLPGLIAQGMNADEASQYIQTVMGGMRGGGAPAAPQAPTLDQEGTLKAMLDDWANSGFNIAKAKAQIRANAPALKARGLSPFDLEAEFERRARTQLPALYANKPGNVR